ncbi:PLDc N-terminal domain-containing protein [Nonomuraea sp. NPDC050556]|uniref:PLDc N-terminal domain-containing protein n=1 Tax=Nonomuraea sp. NPDC050556 TaxID=3364369 RepID=UPI0037B32C2E
MLYEGMGLVLLALWIFCIFDVLTTPEEICRNAPKVLWLILVLLLPLIGSVLWLVAGRPERRPQTAPGRFPEYDRPGRFVATNPDDDEEFLRKCRERAEEQRRNAPKRPEDD